MYGKSWTPRVRVYRKSWTGYSTDFPEHDPSTPAETKIVTIVLPSCIILRL